MVFLITFLVTTVTTLYVLTMKLFILRGIHNVNIFMSVQTIHFLRLPSPPKKTKHQHILSAKNPHENNKNQAKKSKVYRKNVNFMTTSLPLKVYGLYNVDIYGWSLS